MSPVVSYIATLIVFGVAFTVLHLFSWWLELPDLAALLLLAVPVVVFIAYCTRKPDQSLFGPALRIYCGFASVVLASAGLVYLIGD